MLFLIFVVPQLQEWAVEDSPIGRLARGLIGAVLLTLWSAFLLRWCPAGLDRAIFALKELTNWALFFSFLYLLFRTLPPWVTAGLFPTPRISIAG